MPNSRICCAPVLLFMLASTCWGFQGVPEDSNYQLDLTPGGAIPKTPFEAESSAKARKTTVVQFLACGQEINFLNDMGDAKTLSGEDPASSIVAKLYWLAGMPTSQYGADGAFPSFISSTPTPCRISILVDLLGLSPVTFVKAGVGLSNYDPAVLAMIKETLNSSFGVAFGQECNKIVANISKPLNLTLPLHGGAPPVSPPDTVYFMTFDVSTTCLRLLPLNRVKQASELWILETSHSNLIELQPEERFIWERGV